MLSRFKKFMMWLGISTLRLNETRPNDICRTISEFALEYRTTRERVLQLLEKKDISSREKHRKTVIDIDKARTNNAENIADVQLR